MSWLTVIVSDISVSDKKFLNKEIELTGGIKSFLQFESDKSLLELKNSK